MSKYYDSSKSFYMFLIEEWIDCMKKEFLFFEIIFYVKLEVI